jgi:hypothetical protein
MKKKPLHVDAVSANPVSATSGWDYFVSYTKPDKEWAEWVVWVLEQRGYTCFAQFTSIAPGSDFVQRMNDGLRRSRQMLAILSPDYLKSEIATSELNTFLALDPVGHGRRLIPISIKSCKPTGLLATRVYVDLVGKGSSDAVNCLVRGLEAAKIGLAAAASSTIFQKPPKYPGDQTSDQPQLAAPPMVDISTKILFLASMRGTGLDLRGQARAINESLRSAKQRGCVVFDARYDVLAEDFAEVINSTNPQIVHFSGKQNGQRILVPTGTGGVTTISAAALTGLFLNLADTVRLVIVDTCHSLDSARELVSAVDFAIGVEGDIYDSDAIKFYKQFYSSLASGLPLKKALGQATATLDLSAVDKRAIPELRCKATADANHFRIAAVS